MIIEFNEMEYPVYNKIVELLKSHPSFTLNHLSDELVLTLSGIEIHPDRRKVYCNSKEIKLTTKEYTLLYYLAANKGRVLTYSQIYHKVWGEESFGNEKNAICCHIHKLKGKIMAADPNTKFYIECVRDVGYCCDIKKE